MQRSHTVAVLVVAVVVTLSLGACGGSDGARSEPSPTSRPATSTGPTATTAVASTSTSSSTTTAAPSTTTVVQTPLPSGPEAIDAVLAAWEVGDRAAALLVASPEAVEALFAVPVQTREARGCNRGTINTAIQCVFRLPAGELQVRARPNLDGSGYLVDFAILGS